MLHFKKISYNKDFWVKATIALAATLIIVWFYPRPQANRYVYELGRPWNYTKLIASFDIPVHPSQEAIEAAKDSLDAKFVPVYLINQLMVDSIIKELPQSPLGSNYDRQLTRMIRDLYASGVVDMTTKDKIDKGELPNVRILDVNVLSEASTSEFSSPKEVYSSIEGQTSDIGLKAYIKQADLPSLLRPNIIYSPEESKRHYDQAYLTLTADRGVIQQGQTIIDKGNIITPQDFTNLKTYEEMMEKASEKDNASRFLLWMGQFLYVLSLMSIILIYLHIYEPKIMGERKALIFVFGLVTVFFLSGVALDALTPQGVYLTPLCVIPLLMVVFFNSRTALFVSIVATLIIAGMTSFPLEYIYLQLTASSATVFSMKDLTKRSDIIRTSVVVIAAYILSLCFLELLMNGAFDGISPRMLLFLTISGMLTSLAFVMMFVIERVFGFVSAFTLVEIADTNSDLLRKLSDECPGTFQHSIAVSTLAVDAAKKIDANVNLIRAGALYHDIGKMNNPAFFTENQRGANPHDGLLPEQSAQIIINHVKDGIALASKNRLPDLIKDFIREHHGKGKAKYFFYQYCNAHPGETVDEAPFTYPGPNPHSRETSILMMADSIEAASRSLKSYTQQDIVSLVDKIVDGQIAEGLHNDSPLEIRDIPLLKKAFVKRLQTMYHSRVAYPDAPNRPK